MDNTKRQQLVAKRKALKAKLDARKHLDACLRNAKWAVFTNRKGL